MGIPFRWSLGFYFIFGTAWGLAVSPDSSHAVAVASTGSSRLTEHATCDEWASWAPPRTRPAMVLQAVSENYVDLERNFIRLMELNSVFTRHHLFLMCMDDASIRVFASLGIRCVPVGGLVLGTIEDIWKMRVRALSCLVRVGYDVIMSDADALWLRDPMEYFSLPGVKSSSVVSSRGIMPFALGRRWGATMCLGFILFRSTGGGMNRLLESIENLIRKDGDDQVAVNFALFQFGVYWDEDSDMRHVESTGLGRGTLDLLQGGNGEPLVVTLLPHNAFTRRCMDTAISNNTVVAHCTSLKVVGLRVSWMQEAHLWSIDSKGP